MQNNTLILSFNIFCHKYLPLEQKHKSFGTKRLTFNKHYERLTRNQKNCSSWFRSRIIRIAWENRQHFATPRTVSPRNDVWETSVEIPYWWRVTTRIWVVLLIGWGKFHKRHDQSEALPRSRYWCVVSVEFLRSFLRRHFAGKPLVASWNVLCFLRLWFKQPWQVQRGIIVGRYWIMNNVYFFIL